MCVFLLIFFILGTSGRGIQLDEEAKLGDFFLFFFFFFSPFLSSSLFEETEIKEEKKYVMVLNKEVNDIYGRIAALQNKTIDKKISAKILESISFKESQIKDIIRRISDIQTRLADTQTRTESIVI